MKRIISVFLGVCLVITLNVIPVTADTSNPITKLKVGNEVVVSADPMEVTTTSGSGWSYSEGVLTLENFILENTELAYLIDCYGDLTIDIKGVNTLTTNNPDYDLIYGIRTVGNLTIKGGGTLNINMSIVNPRGSNYPILSEESIIINNSKVYVNNSVVSEGNSFAGGICAHNGISIITSEVISNVNAPDTFFSSAIETRNGNLDISGGANVKGIVNGHMSMGIITYGNIIVNNSNLYGEGKMFGIAAMLTQDRQVSQENSANLIIQITDSNYKVEGKATSSITEIMEEFHRILSKPVRKISSSAALLTPDLFTVADAVAYAKQFMTDENMLQYYDFSALQVFLENHYESTDFTKFASLGEIHEDIEGVLNENLNGFGKYSIIPMAIYVNKIQYNSEVKVLTPENGFTGKINYIVNFFNDYCETVFGNSGELPALHGVLGITRTPVIEGVTEDAITQREPIVADAVATGDANIFYLFLIGMSSIVIGTIVLIRRKRIIK